MSAQPRSDFLSSIIGSQIGRYVAIILFVSAVFPASASDDLYDKLVLQEQRQLPVPKPVIGISDPAAFYVSGDAALQKHHVVTAEGQPFSKALQVSVLKIDAKNPPWTVQIVTPVNSQPVHKGDRVLFAFSVRCMQSSDATGTGTYHAILGHAKAPWTSFAEDETPVGKEWRRIYVSGIADKAYPVGDMHLVFHLSYHPQALEIGGLTIFDLGPNIDARALPYTHLSYDGEAPDASWRKAADARIDNIRKGDLTILVTDANGQPIQDAEVHVQMKRHAYAFGNMAGRHEFVSDPDAAIERQWLVKWFNRATIPFFAPYPGLTSVPSDPRALTSDADIKLSLTIAQWLRENHISMRAHPVVYPGWHFLPTAAERFAKSDPEALRAALRAHIADGVDRLKDYVDDFNVVNELRNLHDVTDILGFAEVAEWFRVAHEHAPNAHLSINENTILTNDGKTEREQDIYAVQIQSLLNAKVGLDVIGLQGHFGTGLTPPERLLKVLDRFSAFGLPIEITEFDVDVDDEQAQADYLRDFMTVIFSHPATKGILQWGFWDDDEWRPRGALVRKDWTIKPSGQAYLDLVFKRWWTDVTGVTDAEGAYGTRGSSETMR